MMRSRRRTSVVRYNPTGYAPGGVTYRPRARPKIAPRARTPVNLAPPSTPTAGDVVSATQPGVLSGGAGGYDIGSDPAVAAAHGISEKIRAQAAASALAKRIQAATEYGSAEGLQQALGGQYADVQAKAAANPFSVMASQKHAYDVGLRDLEEQLNNANLFYSGYRGQQLGEAARGYQQNQYEAANAYHGLLNDISDQLSQALMSADQYDMQAALGSTGGSFDNPSEPGTGQPSISTSPRPGALPRPRPRPRFRTSYNPFVPPRSRGSRTGSVHVGSPVSGGRI